MNKKELYKELGLIDEDLVAAALTSGGEKQKKKRSKKWVVLVACLVLYCSTSTILLAAAYYKDQNTEPYIRYLTAESLELMPTPKFEAEKFLEALKSDNNEYVYIAINRLIETFNDEKLREQAIKEIQPFLKSENEKIADAATFALDLLTKTYQSPMLTKLKDGSIVFTLFNNYSDYGSQNVLWKIKDDKLEEFFSFSSPSMYITDIVASPNKQLIAVVTSSNKSEFVQIINVEEGKISPEIIESARVNYGAQKGLDTWIRTDHENYNSVMNISWKDNDTLEIEASLAYDDTAIIENVHIVYQSSHKVMEVKAR
ncbi:MAG: hypothetical protein ABS944_08410 [Solibacillus sp.]|uniref:hypothetical protein n=1 Tax=Solibacillus sp. TaxID=1909654 RepID=UPI0033157895